MPGIGPEPLDELAAEYGDAGAGRNDEEQQRKTGDNAVHVQAFQK